MQNISKNITYKEAVKSQTASRRNIDNTPDDLQLSRMRLVAKEIFQPVREHFNVPIGVSSFFRSELLNKAIGGSLTSSHVKGEAIDIDADMFGGVTNKQLFDFIKDNLTFDQLIWEFGTDKEPAWVHASYRAHNNRCQILKAYKEKKWNGASVTKYKIYND